MKLVGGDSGRYQRETFVEEVLLAPSERAIVDVQFDRAGVARLEHRTPDRVYDLGAISVVPTNQAFAALRVDAELTAIAADLDIDRRRAPDKTLAFRSTMPLLYGAEAARATAFACPMHPEITSSEPSRCPKCGMTAGTLPIPTQGTRCNAAEVDAHTEGPRKPQVYACPMHPDVTGTGPTECPKCGMWLEPIEAPAVESPSHDADLDHLDGDGLEWEDLMPGINRQTDPSNMIWSITDLETGAENHHIFWTFTVGDRIKIRLVNELGSDHPMHHPFHIHGAGRFLVLARDGKADDNLVWKDTVLIPAGQTVDILLDVTNPGRWMAHCHIAEHIESGMMFSFDVLPRGAAS